MFVRERVAHSKKRRGLFGEIVVRIVFCFLSFSVHCGYVSKEFFLDHYIYLFGTHGMTSIVI